MLSKNVYMSSKIIDHKYNVEQHQYVVKVINSEEDNFSESLAPN